MPQSMTDASRPLVPAAPAAAGQRSTTRTELIVSVVTFLLALGVYTSSLAPDLTWAHKSADGAELITAAVTLGIPHPPGYPLYVLMGKLASALPFGAVAFRFNLFSAVCTAIAAALLAFLAAKLAAPSHTSESETDPSGAHQQRVAIWATALFCGTTFAFAPVVWRHAVVAEVYALNLLVVAVFLLIALSPTNKRLGMSAGLLIGLALTTHLTSVILAPVALIGMARMRRARFIAGFGLGLTPFLLLPLLAAGDSPVVWGAPHTLREWWWLVSAEIYQPNLFSLPPVRWSQRLLTWAAEPTLWIAMGLGVLALATWKTLEKSARRLACALLLSALAYFIVAFTYDTSDSIVLVAPAIVLITLAVATAQATKPLPRLRLLLPLALVVLNFESIDLSGHHETRMLAQFPMREAPSQAIVLTSGDHATFTMWYLQHVEGQRKDLVIVDSNLLAFDWYRHRLQRSYPAIAGLENDDVEMLREINSELRPWCELRIEAGNRWRFWCMEDSS